MPRLRRLPAIPFGWYYVALQAERGRTLVKSRADLRMFYQLLQTILKKKGAHLHAKTVTPNEVHLALQTGEQAVTSITRSLCRVYARWFNRTHGETGELFKSHPHVLLIDHQVWLVPLAHVIHWIPRLRSFKSGAHVCWCSSDIAYRSRKRWGGLTKDVILRMVSGGARRRSLQDEAYRKRFDNPPDEELLRLFEQGTPEDPRMLGDAKFMRGVWDAIGQRAPRRVGRTRRANGDIRPAVATVVERFRVLCDETLSERRARVWKRVVTLDQLCSQSRKQPLPMIRAISASHVIERHIATRAETARFFGCGPENLSAHRRRRQELRFAALFHNSSLD